MASDPVAALRTHREEGVAILDELVRAKDAEASRAVATERAWVPKLLAALAPWGEAVQARFEPIGVLDRDEEAFAERHLSAATLADSDHQASLRCHAVRVFRLDRLWKRIENATPVSSHTPTTGSAREGYATLSQCLFYLAYDDFDAGAHKPPGGVTRRQSVKLALHLTPAMHEMLAALRKSVVRAEGRLGIRYEPAPVGATWREFEWHGHSRKFSAISVEDWPDYALDEAIDWSASTVRTRRGEYIDVQVERAAMGRLSPGADIRGDEQLDHNDRDGRLPSTKSRSQQPAKPRRQRGEPKPDTVARQTGKCPGPPKRPAPEDYEWLAHAFVRTIKPLGADGLEKVRYALANDRVERPPILRDEFGQSWPLPARVWNKDGAEQILRDGWVRINMGYPNPAGPYASGHIFVPQGAVKTILECKDPERRDQADRKARTKRGEPKPKTIAGWKTDHDDVVRLMQTHECGPTRAARIAHAPGERSADAIERGYRRYKLHRANAAKRQNGKNSRR